MRFAFTNSVCWQSTVQVCVRDNNLFGSQYQCKLPFKTQPPSEIAAAASYLHRNARLRAAEHLMQVKDNSVHFREVLIKSAAVDGERFFVKTRLEKRGNTVCISRFSNRRSGGKDPSSAVGDLFRGSLIYSGASRRWQRQPSCLRPWRG